ncbi:MAG: aminoacyl-tRNA hydrolase [Propionibacteriaceae bacterium]|nr:aminoacyl-tRNA hydrolase [Propionibacteriaceae bacterium]
MKTWLVVGLGNPGSKYAQHRHNIGFAVVEELAKRAKVAFNRKRLSPFDAAQTPLDEAGIGASSNAFEKVALIRPHTYMNESGRAVAKAVKQFGVKPEMIVIIHDELDIDFAKLRLKFGGGDNGHNGLKSIRASLGTGDFYRVRFGIGRPPGRQEPQQFVLRPFSALERKSLDVEVIRAADAVEALLTQGLERAQNLFNS